MSGFDERRHEVHRHGRHKTGRDVDGILNPEHGHIQDQIADGAAPDASNDSEPHEPHHVHPFARSDECSRHREDDGRQDVEGVDEAGQVRRIINVVSIRSGRSGSRVSMLRSRCCT